MLSASGVSDRGRVRPVNEDCFGIDERLQFLVIADGLGGHNGGEVASRLAVDAVTFHVRGAMSVDSTPANEEPATSDDWPFGFDASRSVTDNLLRTAVHMANMQILETALGSDELHGMGTTLVAAMIRRNRLSIAHVGDSRLYLLSENRLRLVTHDDSWMADMLANDPHADSVALQHHPMRHALTNVVGAETGTEVHVVEEAIEYGDWLVLTTDGVHGLIDDRRIEQIVIDGSNPAAIAASLVETALARGSRDNCTAVVARYLPDL